MGNLCRSCQEFLIPPCIIASIATWSGPRSMPYSFRRRTAARSASYSFDKSGMTYHIPTTMLAGSQRRGMKTGSIWIRRQASWPDPWSVLEIQDGPSKVHGEILVFEPGMLEFFPPLESIPFDIGPSRRWRFRAGLKARFPFLRGRGRFTKKPGLSSAEKKYISVSSYIREKFQQWLQECISGHEECKSSSDSWHVPTGLIRVSREDARSGPPSLKATLCELRASLPVRYLAPGRSGPDYPDCYRTDATGSQPREFR